MLTMKANKKTSRVRWGNLTLIQRHGSNYQTDPKSSDESHDQKHGNVYARGLECTPNDQEHGCDGNSSTTRETICAEAYE